MSPQAHSEPPKLYVVPSGPEIIFEIEEAKPLIPDGNYLAVCAGCDIKFVFQTLKAFLRFRIVDGAYEGVTVFKAYRVQGKIIPGKGPGTGPRPRLKRGSDLFKMLCRVLELPVNTKAHRVSHKELNGKLCRVSTRTVERDSKQVPLPEAARYSVVADVLSLEAG